MTRMMNLASETDHRIAVTLFTGFLGSGKTTLLNQLLGQPEMAGAAVIVNEFGEVPIDQYFIDAPEDDIAMLPNGCLCCVARDGLEEALIRITARPRGEDVPLSRIFIETSGMADPAPLAQLVMDTPLPAGRLALEEIIATVDGENLGWQIDQHTECVKQIAIADRLIFTKADRISPDLLEAARRIALSINAAAAQHSSRHGIIEAAAMAKLGDAGPTEVKGCDEHRDMACHHQNAVVSWSAIRQPVLDWVTFARWFRRIRREHGDALLRVKGVLDVAGEGSLLAIDAIHHVAYPPRKLPRSAAQGDETKIVFIAQGLSAAEIEDEWNTLITQNNQRHAAWALPTKQQKPALTAPCLQGI